jgi:hypothetical protein
MFCIFPSPLSSCLFTINFPFRMKILGYSVHDRCLNDVQEQNWLPCEYQF